MKHKYEGKAHEKGEGQQYQMQSDYAENVHQTNDAMGYHNMADLANTAKKIHDMRGPKSRVQEMGKPGDGTESSGPDY